MMKSKEEKNLNRDWKQVAAYPFVKGPVLGAGVMMLATPGLNWTNHVLNNKPMVWKNAMSGSFIYAFSSIPSYAVVFMTKNLLQDNTEKSNLYRELTTSFIAGAFSGFVGTPFEAIAQNKQLTNNPSSQSVRSLMIKNNGYSSLFQGACSIMFREGIWSTIYLTAIPSMTNYFQSKGIDKNKSEALALILTAGSYGFFSSPLYQLRFKKQFGLTEPIEKKGYLEHAKDIWKQNTDAAPMQRVGFFFKACLPRTATTTFAAALICKGQELYNEWVESKKM